MRQRGRLLLLTLLGAAGLLLAACGGGGDEPEPNAGPTPAPQDTTVVTPPGPGPSAPDTTEVVPPGPGEGDDSTATAFAKGADISWCTQMEAEGHRFYDWRSREPQECTAVMKSLGMNAIRLRVLVGPADGYCALEDVLEKARRAAALGLDVMVDFHYSDTIARVAEQRVPSSWENHEHTLLLGDVRLHTEEVLEALMRDSIEVKWVQVGNETDEGLLWPEGGASRHPDQYAALLKAGIEAARAVYPDAEILVHLGRSCDQQRCKRHLDVLRQYGVGYDLIGLSLRPSELLNQSVTTASGQTVTVRSEEEAIALAVENMAYLSGLYERPCMLVEVGLPVQYETRGTLLMTNIMLAARQSGVCRGVFYWEPESFDGWMGYGQGAFLSNGHPTQILNAFEK